MWFNWSLKNEFLLTCLRKVKGISKEEVTKKLTQIGLKAANGSTRRAILGGTIIPNPNGKGFAVRLQYDPKAPEGTTGEFPKFIDGIPIIFKALDDLVMMT